MKTKLLVLGAFIAGILSAIFGGKAFATAGNTAEISSGTWEICVNATLDTQSPDFSFDITKSGFESQLVLGGGECKTIKLTGSSAYTVSLGNTMGASSVNYEVSGSSLTFNVANSLNNYLNAFGSVTYTTEGSGEESDFELLFSMPGTCYLNGNANVSGETCADSDGNPLTDRKYIDTGVALFSEGNAARDFEVYFTLDDYASTQPNNQGTLFNAMYENSSMYYPGFTFRMSGSSVQTMELNGRIGNDNTAADKAKKEISTASLKGKEMKIVRVDGLVSYSIDGGELIDFQNFKNFSRYFEQSAAFGASLQPNGNPQRYYDGTISNIRIYLKKVGSIEFNANGGSGTMEALENKNLGSEVVLPANTFTKDRAAFTGWNTESDGSGTAYADEATVTIASEDTLTLYAQWEDIQVGSIEFNANGGSGTMATIEDIPVGTSATLPANTFTRTDYIFNGWNTESDGSGTGYADEATVTISSEDTLVLYAQWLVEPKGSIEFNANGGTGTMAAIENITLGTNVTLPANAFTKNKAIFTGWNTEADGSGADYANGAAVTISTEGTLTLYAQWEDIQVGSIEFNANGGTGTMAAIENMPLGAIMALPENLFTRTNYVFNGWNTESNGSGVSYADGAAITISSEDTLTLYAQWREPKGSIVFNANGGTGTMAAIENIALGTNVTLPANAFTNADAVFAGWNTEVGGSGAAYTDEGVVTISSDGKTVLYAQWTSVSTTLTNGTKFNSKLKSLAKGSEVTVNDSDELIKNLEFVDALPGVVDENTPKVNVALDDNKIPVYAYWVASDETIYIHTEADKIYAPNNLAWMFASMQSLTSLVIPAYFDTSRVSDMGCMFCSTQSLASLTLPDNFDTSKVTYMGSMFSGMRSLTSLTLPDSFDTSRVTNMSSMFQSMSSVTSLTLPPKFNTSKVTNMYRTFFGMSSLTSLTLPSSFDTSRVTNMSGMFTMTSSLTSLTLPYSFNTSQVTNMNQMFSNMSSLTTLAFSSNFNTSQVTDMGAMFSYTLALTSLTLLDNFDTSQVANMGYMFYYTQSLSSLSFPSSFDTSRVTNMRNMFAYTGLTSLNLPYTFKTSNVTDMSNMFNGAKALTSLSFSGNFDTSNVTNMSHMFYMTYALTSLNLPVTFNTSNVTDMSAMFDDSALTSLTLPVDFNTTNVTDMNTMFYGMQSLTSLTLPDSFVISNGTITTKIFDAIPRTAILYATNAKVRLLWRGVLGN